MPFVKPTISADDFDSSSFENENFGKIVPAGSYTMEIGKIAVIRRSKANPGNQYINVQLNHTGALAGSNPAFAMVMVQGTKSDGSPLKTGKLAKFLSALGVTAEDDYAIDLLDEGEDEKPLHITVRGDTIPLTGQTVRAALEIEEYNGKERNSVAFIVPAE